MLISKDTNTVCKYRRPTLFAVLSLLYQLVSNTVVGQEIVSPVATVSYEVQKIVTFGIPEHVSLSALEDYDIATIRPYAKQHKISKSLFPSGNIETTSTYPEGKGNPDTWIQPIYRSVADCFGVKFYDAQQNEIYRSQFEQPNLPIPYESDEIAGFGYVAPITAPTQENLSSMVSSGFQVQAKSDGSYILSDATTTFFVDPIRQTYQTRTTKEGELIFDEKVTIMQLSNGRYVVGAKESKSYHPTFKGDFFIEETDLETYSNFTRDQLSLGATARLSVANQPLPVLGKKEMYAYQSNYGIQNLLQVGPNPTNGDLKIKLESAMNDPSILELLDLSGKLIRKFGEILPHEPKTIDLSTVGAGTYLLRAANDSFSLYQKIVKL